jgi:hypothetical protein
LPAGTGRQLIAITAWFALAIMGDIGRVITQRKDPGERLVTEEYIDPRGESELRRRAAWLLAMLVVVAALVVILMVVFLKGGKDKPNPNGIKPIPTAPPSTAQRHQIAPVSNAPTTGSSISTPTRVTHHHVSCPSDAPCIAHGDIGNAVAAINAYRTSHGASAVSGTVTPAAQTCAVTNGSQCTGSWAESQLPSPNGKIAVEKVQSLTDLLSASITSLEVGWAYDPTAREYYFAVISDDS